MRKEILEKRMKRLEAKKLELRTKCDAATDAAEVRSLIAQLEDLNADIEEVREELESIEAEERSAQATADTVPETATLVNGNVRGHFEAPSETREDVDPTSTKEYRMAFKAYVQNGTPIPSELRSGDAISTAETGAAACLPRGYPRGRAPWR